MLRIVAIIITLLGTINIVAAQGGKLDFNRGNQLAYNQALSLRFEEADKVLKAELDSVPNNLMPYYIANYIDFFKVFVNENKAEFKRLEQQKQLRLSKLRTADKKSPYYRYSQAQIHLQWALARLKFEEYFTAFTEVRKAYKLLVANERLYPDFVPNQMSLGILKGIIGTIPDEYKWGVNLLGMSGSIEEGQLALETVLVYAQEQDYIFEQEAVVMYALLLLHLKNDNERAWNLIQSDVLNTKENPLACFIKASIAMRTGHNDAIIEMLETRPKGAIYHEFHFLSFMLGLAKLYRLDTDADLYLKAYVNNFKGRNYIKEAYQKLAWDALLKGNQEAYHKYINLCASKGAAVVDVDKKALKETRNSIQPHRSLLVARLLFDGAYYQRAKDSLLLVDTTKLNTAQQLEWTYRLGRILHKSENYNAAINYYIETLNKGANLPYYFACNAALQLGLVYEHANQKALATTFYKRCLALNPDEYKTSLHQKAKAGLQRVKTNNN